MGAEREQLIVNRRSCHRFLDKNVDLGMIAGMLTAMSAAPTGGNYPLQQKFAR